MSAERYTLLGLAGVRSPWFRDVGRWSTAASLPLELVKTISTEEVRARLRSGRAFSALVVDDLVPGLDRDLFEEAAGVGCAVVVVDSGRSGRRWTDLGASAVLAPDFDATALLQLLGQVARPVGGEVSSSASAATEALGTSGPSDRPCGRLIAVLGAGGTGVSTLVMGLAQHLGGQHPGEVCLADLALHAEHAVLHGTPDVVPGLSELVEAHRLGDPGIESIRALTWQIATRGYDLLLGLRRHRDWTALRPRSVALALDGIRRSYRIVVADVDPDLEGERSTGSVDVEERNTLARSTVDAADLVVVVGAPEMKGVHAMLRVIREVIEHGVEPARILPVVNRAPRSPRARAELARAIGTLATREVRTDPAGRGPTEALPGPVFLAERRHLDPAIRDVARLPDAWIRPVGTAVHGLLSAASRAAAAEVEDLVPVAPGSLGSWTDDTWEPT
jgi:hypothetical protein